MMKSKLFIFLLLLNLVTTLSVGYIIYKENINKKPTIIEIEPPINGDIEELVAGDKEFKTNVYNGLSRVIYGQNMINLRMLSLHHFMKPHADEFYENCPECQLERQQILKEEKDGFTSNVEGS